MTKPEPPKPPPMRRIKDDASGMLVLPFVAASIVLLALGFIKAFGL